METLQDHEVSHWEFLTMRMLYTDFLKIKITPAGWIVTP